jgi:hypothetical protein
MDVDCKWHVLSKTAYYTLFRGTTTLAGATNVSHSFKPLK